MAVRVIRRLTWGRVVVAVAATIAAAALVASPNPASAGDGRGDGGITPVHPCLQPPCPPVPQDDPNLPVPPGYTAAQETFKDMFGLASGYQLKTNWRFGLTDRPSDGRPWGGTPQPAAPYYGSGTHGQSPGCVRLSHFAEEYSLPIQVRQTSTGARLQRVLADRQWSDDHSGSAECQLSGLSVQLEVWCAEHI